MNHHPASLFNRSDCLFFPAQAWLTALRTGHLALLVQ